MSNFDKPKGVLKKCTVFPLVCPYCDEPAFPVVKYKREATNYRVYILRECPMGHRFYSVEEVPENQSEIAEELKEIKIERRREYKRNWDRQHSNKDIQ